MKRFISEVIIDGGASLIMILCVGCLLCGGIDAKLNRNSVLSALGRFIGLRNFS